MSLTELNFWCQRGNTRLQVLVKSDFLPFQPAFGIPWPSDFRPVVSHDQTFPDSNLVSIIHWWKDLVGDPEFTQKIQGHLLTAHCNLIISARSFFIFFYIAKLYFHKFEGIRIWASLWGLLLCILRYILSNFCGTSSPFLQIKNLCFQLGESAWRTMFF